MVSGPPPLTDQPGRVSTAPRPPRVLLYTDDPQHGGVAQYNHAVLLELARRGFAPTCVQTTSDSPLVQEQQTAGVRHRWLPYDTGKEFIRTVTDLETPRDLFEREKPDLIIFSDCSPVSNLAARQAAVVLHIPFVVVVGFAAPYLAERFEKCLPLLAQHYVRAREVIAVSQENLNLLRSRFGLRADRGRVIHYGRPERFFAPVDPDVRARLRQEAGIAPTAFVSLTTARLSAVKGYRYQLAALETLRQSRAAENLVLVWLGEGELRAGLEKEITQRGLSARVRLLGHRWDVADWYDAADCFTLPSEAEGMPLAVMEAMAKGRAVAATAVSGIPEELGATGRLLADPKRDPCRTVQELSEVWRHWSESAARCVELGSAARRRAESLFREEIMLARTFAVLGAQLPAINSAPSPLS